MNKENFTILITDDEEHFRKLISRILEHRLNAKCYEAKNGKQALKIYKEKQIDIVISDYDMPGMNGLELLEKILAYDKQAKVIIASGNPDKTISRKLISAGAKKYIYKPDNLLKLTDAIKKIWQKYTQKLQENKDND